MFYIKSRRLRPLMQYGRRLGSDQPFFRVGSPPSAKTLVYSQNGALPVLLTTARVFIDKQIDIWTKVVKDNGSRRMERWVQPSRERGLWVPFCFIGELGSDLGG